VRSHAKASPVGSISGRGGGLGSFRFVLVAACSLACLALLAPAASAAPGTKGVVSSFGGFGSLGGQFSGAAAVAVNDSSGDVYVLDRFNNRVQQLSSSGAFIRAWGLDVIQSGKPGDLGSEAFEVCTFAADCKEGAGFISPAPGGEFSFPQGIAIDQSDGSVYVYEREFARVQKFSSTGAFQLAFGKDVDNGGGTGTEVCAVATNCQAGATGSLGGEFGSAFSGLGLAVAPAGAPNAGNVLVADPGNRRVQEFTSSGAFVRAFGFDVAGAGAGADDTGTGFEVCTQAVAGAANCQAGTAGSGVGQFASEQPTRVAVDTTGAIYTVESESNNRVQKFTPQAGPPPLAPSVFAAAQLSGSPAPTDVTVDPTNDHVYVTKPSFSPSDRRVHELDSSGAPQFTHGIGSGLESASGLAVKAGDGPIYQSTEGRVFILDNLTPPTAEMDTPAVDSITSTSAMLHGKVNPNGPPDVSYRFEYSLNGTSWTPVSTPDTLLGSQVSPQSVSQLLEPAPLGLEPNTLYHVRVVATRPFNASVASTSTTFKTLSEAPIVETTGAPIRTTTTAQLNGRFVAFNAPTTYHFEYGLTDAYGQSTPPQPGGSSGRYQLVAEELTGLKPDTTYHYRLVADNGVGSPVSGEDMTVTTRASEPPLSHGDFPGPPGSDRVWEQVSAPDTSGNPVSGAAGFSDDGNSAYYNVSGGTPQSAAGSIWTKLFSKRTADGWKNTFNLARRDQANANIWSEPEGSTDLSESVVLNWSFFGAEPSSWRLYPDKPAKKVFSIPTFEWGRYTAASEDGSRVVWALIGPQDPEHPATPGSNNLYDVTSGSPELLSFMPDGSLPACGLGDYVGIIQLLGRRHWVSRDGSFVVFPSKGNACGAGEQLFVRDIEGEETVRMSGPAISGLECGAIFIKSTPGAAFFWTADRLVAEDTAPSACNFSSGNVYRYDFNGSSLDCVTCIPSAPNADVNIGSGTTMANQNVGVSEDGSRVYFRSASRLLPGAAADGVYRVDVSSGELAYIGQLQTYPSDVGHSALTKDGSVLVFKSSNPSLNPLGGQDNNGTTQSYRYNDLDGSLVCVSCPQDGSAPISTVPGDQLVMSEQVGQNTTPISEDGDFIFITPTALVSTDQNTDPATPNAGMDLYEWRDGRLLLVTDGLTNWPVLSGFESQFQGPRVAGITPSGRDVFFTVPAQYTPDALDGYPRLYDARIGGGIVYPRKPKPCPLEVCQGTPKGAPEEPPPGTGAFAGRGNAGQPPVKRCAQGKRKVRRGGKTRCVKRQKGRSHRANDNRRNAR
jgi:hypothetical protein